MTPQLFFVFLKFCGGAFFTTVDIGTDTSLVLEYHNVFANLSTKKAPPAFHPIKPLHIDWIRTIGGVEPEIYQIFSSLTMLWICLGGLTQTIAIIYLTIRKPDLFAFFPKPVKVVLVVSSLSLLGPVVVNIFGAIYIIKNRNGADVEDNVQR